MARGKPGTERGGTLLQDWREAVSWGTKSETLTIRLDARMRFLLDLLVRLREQTYTKIVERAVAEFASSPENAARPTHEALQHRRDITWEDYWDPHEGVRVIKMVTYGGRWLILEERELQAFVEAHRPFFYEFVDDYGADGERIGIKPHFKNERIYVLWERLGEFLNLWRKSRATDTNAAARAMSDALSAAGVTAPDWPPVMAKADQRSTKSTASKKRS